MDTYFNVYTLLKKYYSVFINMESYFCNTCNKKYASYKSPWNHNKKFHRVKEVCYDNNSTCNDNNSTFNDNNSTCNVNNSTCDVNNSTYY